MRFSVCCLALAAAAGLAVADDGAPPPVDELRRTAEAGDARAQLELGFDYFTGANGRTRSPEQAAYWFRLAAEAGLPEAWYNLGYCFETGFGVARDPHRALQYYRLAGGAGIGEARLREAALLYVGLPETSVAAEVAADPAAGRALLEELADGGMAAAARQLGIFLLEEAREAGDERSLTGAFEQLDRAARGGDPVACRLAAEMLIAGDGCAADPERAVKLLTSAAQAGDPEAAAQLAFCLEFGIGCTRDAGAAFRLYSRAAQAGVPAAQLRMGEYYLSGDEVGGIDTAKGLEYFQQAAQAQLPAAWYRLGLCYAQGLGVGKDMRTAADYFLRAARAGEREAQYNLGCLFLSGEGIPEDPGAAFFWFKRAADGGDVNAQRQLAYCYFEGIGTEPDDRQGLRWLVMAARGGDEEARAILEGN